MYYVNFGSVTAVGIVFPILGLLALGLRMHYWATYVRRFQLEETLIIPAVLIMVAAGVGFIIGGQGRFLGGHSPTVSLQSWSEDEIASQVKLEKLEYALYTGFYFCIGLAKLSILLYFRRLFKGPLYWTIFDYVNWTLIVAVFIWMIGCALATALECGSHASDAWTTVSSLHSQCIETLYLDRVSTVVDGFVDVAILVEPLIVISQMRKWERGQKLQVSLIFFLAIFAVAVALTKMVIWLEVTTDNLAAPTQVLPDINAYDLEGLLSTAMFWTFLEMGVGCIVACILPCRRYLGSFKIPMGHLMDRFTAPSTRKGTAARDLHTNEMQSTTAESQIGFANRGENNARFDLSTGKWSSSDYSKQQGSEVNTWSTRSWSAVQQSPVEPVNWIRKEDS